MPEKRQNTRDLTTGWVHTERRFALEGDREVGGGYAQGSGRGPRGEFAAEADRRVRGASQISRSRHILLLIALVTAVMLFAFSVIRARGHAVGSWGLLPLLGVPFLVAVVLTSAVLLVALRFIHTAWPTALSALCLLLVEFNGTQVMLDSNSPVELDVQAFWRRGLHSSRWGLEETRIDIYQQWPGFFAAAAQLVRISGSSPLASGNWPHLFFEAFCSIVVFAIARQIRAVDIVQSLI